MTWQSNRPGYYVRGPWVIERVPDKPVDRPWMLRHTAAPDPNRGSRHHTLALAKQSADNWDAVRAGRSRSSSEGPPRPPT